MSFMIAAGEKSGNAYCITTLKRDRKTELPVKISVAKGKPGSTTACTITSGKDIKTAGNNFTMALFEGKPLHKVSERGKNKNRLNWIESEALTNAINLYFLFLKRGQYESAKDVEMHIHHLRNLIHNKKA